MKQSKNIRRKKVLAERKRHERLNPVFPPVDAIGPNVPFVAFVRKQMQLARTKIRDFLTGPEIDAINLGVRSQMMESKHHVTRINNALRKMSDHVCTEVAKSYKIPTGSFYVDIQNGGVIARCEAMREYKSANGIRYYNGKSLIVDWKDDDRQFAMTRHFMERMMERSLSGSPLMRYRGMYNCLNDTLALVRAKNFFRIYARIPQLPKTYFEEQFDIRTDDIYWILGYVAFSVDPQIRVYGGSKSVADFIVGTTLLLPGMRDTPEETEYEPDKIKFLMDLEYVRSLYNRGVPVLVAVEKTQTSMARNAPCSYKFTSLEPKQHDDQIWRRVQRRNHRSGIRDRLAKIANEQGT